MFDHFSDRQIDEMLRLAKRAQRDVSHLGGESLLREADRVTGPRLTRQRRFSASLNVSGMALPGQDLPTAAPLPSKAEEAPASKSPPASMESDRRRRRKQRPRPREGFAYVTDLTEEHGLPRSTVQGWLGGLPDQDCYKDPDCSQLCVNKAAFSRLVARKRGTSPGS